MRKPPGAQSNPSHQTPSIEASEDREQHPARLAEALDVRARAEEALKAAKLELEAAEAKVSVEKESAAAASHDLLLSKAQAKLGPLSKQLVVRQSAYRSLAITYGCSDPRGYTSGSGQMPPLRDFARTIPTGHPSRREALARLYPAGPSADGSYRSRVADDRQGGQGLCRHPERWA
jgi:hypothetical protein